MILFEAVDDASQTGCSMPASDTYECSGVLPPFGSRIAHVKLLKSRRTWIPLSPSYSRSGWFGCAVLLTALLRFRRVMVVKTGVSPSDAL